MGTNYYARINLGGPILRLHIGKSSRGWCFGLHATDEITSLDDWRAVFSQPFVSIVDEYDEVIPASAMIDIITERRFDRTWSGPPTQIWLTENHAARGPNGLARHTHKSTLPPNPATDTYDLCRGDFS